MLRTLLIATTLLTASGSALAYDRGYDRGYGRVVTVEPQFTISFGTRHHDGFRVLYESGGSHYWTHTPYRPSHVIVLPPQHHRVQHVYHHYDNRGGWDKHRKHWRDDRRDDRRGHRDDRRDHRRH
ncbi:MAG: hypothetical protein Q8R61_12515 [Thiobacillus sp.]|uniref:hypothetical protein n=1 Tax=Thiobacillus sp. TaxID=924 RepID=UPI0027324511|nr:hypothetical protein [Thiobacillus sp.]MDP3585945.1 hypothetical protein [Thiobacillus sp.]